MDSSHHKDCSTFSSVFKPNSPLPTSIWTKRSKDVDGAPLLVKNVHGGCGGLLNVGGNGCRDMGSCCSAEETAARVQFFSAEIVQ
ncbi:hypothetical protein V6Z12_D02G167200 [Gossypium hirsutum]|nr:hypothetical protein GOBAR_DD29538 [Gossypium barbadense]